MHLQGRAGRVVPQNENDFYHEIYEQRVMLHCSSNSERSGRYHSSTRSSPVTKSRQESLRRYFPISL